MAPGPFGGGGGGVGAASCCLELRVSVAGQCFRQLPIYKLCCLDMGNGQQYCSFRPHARHCELFAVVHAQVLLQHCISATENIFMDWRTSRSVQHTISCRTYVALLLSTLMLGFQMSAVTPKICIPSLQIVDILPLLSLTHCRPSVCKSMFNVFLGNSEVLHRRTLSARHGNFISRK